MRLWALWAGQVVSKSNGKGPCPVLGSMHVTGWIVGLLSCLDLGFQPFSRYIVSLLSKNNLFSQGGIYQWFCYPSLVLGSWVPILVGDWLKSHEWEGKRFPTAKYIFILNISAFGKIMQHVMWYGKIIVHPWVVHIFFLEQP